MTRERGWTGWRMRRGRRSRRGGRCKGSIQIRSIQHIKYAVEICKRCTQCAENTQSHEKIRPQLRRAMQFDTRERRAKNVWVDSPWMPILRRRKRRYFHECPFMDTTKKRVRASRNVVSSVKWPPSASRADSGTLAQIHVADPESGDRANQLFAGCTS